MHDRRRPLLEGVDPGGEKAQDILVDAHVPLHLGNRRGRRVEIEENVMALAILLDAERERPKSPISPFFDFALTFGDHRRESIGKRLDLRRRDILARNKHGFVQWHYLITPYG